MSRHADGKTHLETECLSARILNTDEVWPMWEYHRHNIADDIDAKRITKLCLSHERLRYERDGVDWLIVSDQKEIESVLALMKVIGECADLHGFDNMFEECCDRLRKMVPNVSEDDE